MNLKWWHWALLAGGGYFAYKMWKNSKAKLPATTEAAQVAATADLYTVAKQYEARLAQAGVAKTLGVTQSGSTVEIYDTATGAVLASGTSVADLQAQLAKI